MDILVDLSKFNTGSVFFYYSRDVSYSRKRENRKVDVDRNESATI